MVPSHCTKLAHSTDVLCLCPERNEGTTLITTAELHVQSLVPWLPCQLCNTTFNVYCITVQKLYKYMITLTSFTTYFFWVWKSDTIEARAYQWTNISEKLVTSDCSMYFSQCRFAWKWSHDLQVNVPSLFSPQPGDGFWVIDILVVLLKVYTKRHLIHDRFTKLLWFN